MQIVCFSCTKYIIIFIIIVFLGNPKESKESKPGGIGFSSPLLRQLPKEDCEFKSSLGQDSETLAQNKK